LADFAATLYITLVGDLSKSINEICMLNVQIYDKNVDGGCILAALFLDIE